MGLDLSDADVYAGLIAFIQTIVPDGTPVIRGQQNRVPMPAVDCVILTTIGAPRRIGTNDEQTFLEASDWTADSDEVTADSLDTADGGASGVNFIATATADFEYSVQADFYSQLAESWSMSAEILWRSKIAWGSLPAGMKPLYSEGRMQLPLVPGDENQ